MLSSGKQVNSISDRMRQNDPAKVLVPVETGSRMGNLAMKEVFEQDLSCPLPTEDLELRYVV